VAAVRQELKEAEAKVAKYPVELVFEREADRKLFLRGAKAAGAGLPAVGALAMAAAWLASNEEKRSERNARKKAEKEKK
jgi:hypothetical protein